MINQIEIRERLFKPGAPALGTNASLWLDKYKNYTDDDEKNRRDLVKEVAEKLVEPPEYRTYFERWQKSLVGLGAWTCEAEARGRMIVGLGSESVLETSICLHRTYGVPSIPGSALKGLAASYAHQRLSEGWQQGEQFHTVVFGNTGDAGYITFLDALYVPGTGKPIPGQALYPDVITVHHQQYYQDASKAPSDSDNPIPVPFISATGKYLLALAAPDLRQQTRWIEITFQILEEALDQFGIGAKTSSGYGRMHFVSSPAQPVDPEVRKAEGYKREIDALRDVAGQIGGYHQKWQQLTSQEARILLAQAIVEKVRKTGREKASMEKAWYMSLLLFLHKYGSEGK